MPYIYLVITFRVCVFKAARCEISEESSWGRRSSEANQEWFEATEPIRKGEGKAEDGLKCKVCVGKTFEYTVQLAIVV